MSTLVDASGKGTESRQSVSTLVGTASNGVVQGIASQRVDAR